MLFNQIISSVTPGQGRGRRFVSLRASLARGARNETSVTTTKLQNTIGGAAGSSPKLLGWIQPPDRRASQKIKKNHQILSGGRGGNNNKNGGLESSGSGKLAAPGEW